MSAHVYHSIHRHEEHAADTEDSDDAAQFAWWNFRIDEETGTDELFLVEESVDYIANIVKEQGPFDGVFGFSQGGMMAAMLLHLQSMYLFYIDAAVAQ